MAAVSYAWLFAVFASCVGAISSEKTPVRRQSEETGKKEVHCLFWGDTRPAGYKAGTTKLNAQLFQRAKDAEAFYDTSVQRGADVVMYYKGCPCNSNDEHSHPSKFKDHYSDRFDAAVNTMEDRSLYTWCKQQNEKYEDFSPDKWHPTSFIIKPPTKAKPAAVTFSLKQSLLKNDEDEGPPTAYSSNKGNMHCVITGKAHAWDSTVTATLFATFEDAKASYEESVSGGSDLVIQYDNKQEWKRHFSARKLKHVPWLSLLNECVELRKKYTSPETHKMISIGQPYELRGFGSFKNDAPKKVNQGLSLAEATVTAKSESVWAAADFAPKTKYEYVQDLLKHGMMRQVDSYRRFQGWECGVENLTDARLVGVDMSVAGCKEQCDKDLQCGCLQYDRSDGACYYMRTLQCNENHCKKSQTNSIYLQEARWTVDAKKVKKFEGKACAKVHGGKVLGGKVLGKEKNVHNDKACHNTCLSERQCTCFNFNAGTKTCTTMKECNLDKCDDSEHDDTFVFEAVDNGYAKKHKGTPW